jgi:hypothetical protein
MTAVIVRDDGTNALTELPAFQRFLQGIPERAQQAPVVSPSTRSAHSGSTSEPNPNQTSTAATGAPEGSPRASRGTVELMRPRLSR